jgi:hypothetical protein
MPCLDTRFMRSSLMGNPTRLRSLAQAQYALNQSLGVATRL